MKKLLLILMLLITITLTGCGGNKVIDIKVDDIYGCIENFNIASYKFIVVYEDKEEEKYMSLEMFSSDDQNKFNEIGEHQVILSYDGFEKVINVIIEERKAIEIIANPSSVSAYLKEFDYEMVNLDIKFNDGSTETYPLSREYLENSDIIKLGKAGTYDIVVTYEDVNTTIHFELLPNETKIEELTQDIIIYCITKKVEDCYQATFYVLANKQFAGVQFKVNKGVTTQNIQIINKNDKVNIISTEDYIASMFVSSENITGLVELFTVSFNSDNQYRNFNLDYNFDNKLSYIVNNEVENIESYLFTFTR